MNVAVFYKEGELLHAMRRLRKKNIIIQEVYSPYPLKEIENGFRRKSRFPYWSLLTGMLGLVLVLTGIGYITMVSWPNRYAGKLLEAIPSFLIMTIVTVILVAGIVSWMGYLLRVGFYPGRTEEPVEPILNEDQFAIVLPTPEGLSDEKFHQLLIYYGASHVRTVANPET